eukprot:3203513-Lingulodinium_polyedra.AAC.1
MDILDGVASCGGSVSPEHPADRGRPPYASTWATPQWRDCARRHACITVVFDQCMLGATSRKPTMIGSNIDGIEGGELF